MFLALALAVASPSGEISGPGINRAEVISACRALAVGIHDPENRCRGVVSNTLNTLHPMNSDTTAKSCLRSVSLPRREIEDQIVRTIQRTQSDPIHDDEDGTIFVTRIILREFPCGIRSYW